MKAGIATYTIRNELERDPYHALEVMAEIGYKTIEFCNIGAEEFPESPGRFAIDPVAFRKKAEDLDIRLLGSVIIPGYFLTGTAEEINNFYFDDVLMRRIFAFNQSINATHVTVGIGFFPDKDSVLRCCERYNKLGEMGREYGLEVYYHNHYQEFAMIDGQQVFDIILENTDPKLFNLELDAYWAFRGMCDPVKIMQKYKERVRLLHMKDFPFEQVRHLDCWTIQDRFSPVLPDSFMKVADPRFFTEWGDGMLKLQEMVDLGNKYNVPYIFVEQDNTALPSEFDSIRKSMEFAKQLRGIDLE